jgi:hypothetical protein
MASPVVLAVVRLTNLVVWVVRERLDKVLLVAVRTALPFLLVVVVVVVRHKLELPQIQETEMAVPVFPLRLQVLR